MSKTGSGLSSAGTSRPISVQPKITLPPLLRRGGDRLQIIIPRRLAEGAETKFVEDDLIDLRPIVSLRDQRLDGKLLLQTTAVKVCSMV